MFLRFYEYFQFLSLLTSLFCYKGLKAFALSPFIPFLFITCTIEFLSVNLYFFGLKSNYGLYNAYLLISLPFYLYFFKTMLHLTKSAKFIFILISILCILLLFLNYFLLQGQKAFNSYSFLLNEIINVVFSCLVLLRLAIEEKDETNLITQPYFWIAAPTLLFSLGTAVVLGLQQYISRYNIQLDGKNIYRVIVPLLNVLLYSGYTYAFILCRIQNNK